MWISRRIVIANMDQGNAPAGAYNLRYFLHSVSYSSVFTSSRHLHIRPAVPGCGVLPNLRAASEEVHRIDRVVVIEGYTDEEIFRITCENYK